MIARRMVEVERMSYVESNNRARIYNGRMYNLHKPMDPWTGRRQKGWVGFRDGGRIGWFATIPEFWRHVELIECRALDPQCAVSLRAEKESESQGRHLLDQLHLWNGKRG